MGKWMVVEHWSKLEGVFDTHEKVTLVIEGFRTKEEAKNYIDWLEAPENKLPVSELAWAGFLEAKRPDPRYLQTECPDELCDLRVLHDGEHMKFR